MSNDNYTFAKSRLPQGVQTETPFSDLNWSYIQDQNGGSSYSGAGKVLVQFDMSSIYSATNMVSPDFYLTIPIVYSCAYSAAGALIAPLSGSWAQVALKSGYLNLIDSVQLEIEGKTINQNVPALNVYNHFKLLSQMSTNDLEVLGSSIGYGKALDNPQSLKYTTQSTGTTQGPIGGNGLINNSVFSNPSNFGDQGVAGPQSSTTYNESLFARANMIQAGTANQSGSGLLGLETVNQMANEFRSYSVVVGNIQYWIDTAVIRMKDLLDSFSSLPLMRRFSGILRFYVNTGSFAIQAGVANGYAVGDGMSMNLSGQNTTFTGTCPLVVTQIPAPTTTYYNTMTGATPLLAITAGLFISKPLTTSVSIPGAFQANLGQAGAPSHPMQSCRIYFSLVTVKPERLSAYLSENRAKTICFTDVLQSTVSGVPAGGNVSQLLQSGVKKIRGVLVVPFISASIYGGITGLTTANTPFSPLQSPFDMAPCQTGPLSITNFNVQVGGVNVQKSVIQYGFSEFLEQVSEYSKINSSDMGLTNGLINYYSWQNAYRPYYMDCSRAVPADAMSPRNIIVQFQNNSNVTCDYYCYVEYFKEFELNVETGVVTL